MAAGRVVASTLLPPDAARRAPPRPKKGSNAMQAGYLELILAWIAIIVPVLGAFGFLYRDTRRGFDRQDGKLDRVGADVTALQVSVARIEGYLGIGFPDPDLDRPTRRETSAPAPGPPIAQPGVSAQ